MTNRRAWQLIGVKGAWTTLILFIFLAGRQIPLPFTSLKAVQGTLSGTSQMIMTMTGGDLVQKSLFSLGLGPWMTSMIIVMVLVRSKHLGIAHKPKRVQNRLENGLILLFAVVQALVMVRQMNFTTKTPFVVDGNALVLVAGTFFTVWLSKLNARRGIGGSMFLVMANITQSMAGNLVAVVKVVRQAGWSPELVWSGLIAGIVGFAFLNVIMDRAELRVPVVHLLTDSKYSSDSYLPIKLTPAGGMPMMFAFSFIALPIYLLQFLLLLWPQSRRLRWWLVNVQMTSWGGATMFCVIIFVLALMFARVNVDPDQQAENMQHRGDYLPGYRPGRATAKELRRLVDGIGLVGAVYLTVFAGLPLYLGIGSPTRAQAAMSPGMILMVIGFSLGMVDQIRALQVKANYRPLF